MDTLDKMIEWLYDEKGEVAPFFNTFLKPRVWRSLVNIRRPKEASPEYLAEEDAYLQDRLKYLPVTTLNDLTPVKCDLYLWQGDITTLAVDAVVNAANSDLLGCFAPCHNCIDNCIHTFAGVRLRLECDRIMKEQGHPEGVGMAKITPGFNLPAKYVLHTVGPIVSGRPSLHQRNQLASCYRACLELADSKGLESVAFCCISTGMYGYPKEAAAKVAYDTVMRYKSSTGSRIKVVFDVFADEDYAVYARLLGVR